MLLFLKDWQPLITPILIFLGWLVIRKNGIHFAKRAEVNSIVKDIQLLLDGILKECKDYWLSSERKNDNYFPMYIPQLLKRLDEKNKSLKAYNVIVNSYHIIELRKAVSLEFKNKLNSEQMNIEKFINVTYCTNELYVHLDELLCGINARKKRHIITPLNGFIFGAVLFVCVYSLF